jgi:hypothetical protein
LGDKCRFAHYETQGPDLQELPSPNSPEVQESNVGQRRPLSKVVNDSQSHYNDDIGGGPAILKHANNSQSHYNDDIGGGPAILKPTTCLPKGEAKVMCLQDDFLVMQLLERIRFLENENVMYQRQVAEVLYQEPDARTLHSNVQGLIQDGHGALAASEIMLGMHRKPPGLDTIKAM